MANVYKSRYTGEQIEQLLSKAEGTPIVTAFPDTQDADYLGAIEIDNRPYLIPKGTSVNANEGAREGGYLYTIEIGADKFLLPKYVEAINAASAGSGTPLKKLTIGDTLYEIPQGVEVKANDGAVEGGYLYTITIGVDKYLLPKYVEAITTSSVPEGVELKGLTIGNQTYTIPAGVSVKANDGAVEGGYLRTLTIGNDKFLLPDYITPNPTADATQTLRKIAIGNVIYELPQGVTPVYYDGEFSTRPIGGATTITFTIDGDHYEAEDGMSWGEWCDSSYNTDGYERFMTRDYGETVGLYDSVVSSRAVAYNNTVVSATDIIVAEREYQFKTVTLGGGGA